MTEYSTLIGDCRRGSRGLGIGDWGLWIHADCWDLTTELLRHQFSQDHLTLSSLNDHKSVANGVVLKHLMRTVEIGVNKGLETKNTSLI